MSRVRLRLGSAAASAVLLASLLPLVGGGTARAEPVAPVSTNLGCDPIDPAACLLPFPNDFFTVADETTDTGRRIAFNPAAMPRNGTEVTEGGEGKPVDPTEWNRNDGFSPGSMVMTYVPGLDLHETWGTGDRPVSEAGVNEPGYFDHRDHIADIALYERPDAPIVIINAETGERHPFWSELDLHPGAADEQVLILRPAVNFEEGARYVVALRDLQDGEGNTIATPESFAPYKEGTGGDEDRQAHFDQQVFPTLEASGVATDDLYLAWDFTIASERNLAERVLHMRDEAFAGLGDTDLSDGIVQGGSPEFVIDSVSDNESSGIRTVEGRVTVPNYLDRIQQTEGHVKENEAPYDAPAPGSRLLDIDQDGKPEQNPVESTVNVPFECRVPLNGEKNFATLYGHGLLGDRGQVGDIKSPQMSGPFAGCAADWWGMSTVDLPTVATILADLSNFPSLPDRAQQGFLNFMFLGRAAVHPQGFVTDEAFQQDGKPLLATADTNSTPLYYDGNSQGGIMGGSLVAVSPDIQRGILGVPGMNYSTLLNRSVDWEGAYAEAYYATYQDPIERQIGFALIQMLWDRGEANGFAHHMTTDPLPNTPPHEVMLQVAFSDHQVTNHAAEVEARTIGAPIMIPGLPSGRHWEMDPYYTPTATYPYRGSSLVYWDSGNATPPNGNIPADHNGDPHGHPRSERAASWQEAQFLLTGWMMDVCGGGDYLTDNHPANGGTPSCNAPDFAPGTRAPDSPSRVTFTSSSDTSGQYSDEATFEARMTDAAGEPVAGEAIEFTFADRTFDATTNDDGVAAVTTELTEVPGDYVVTASHPESFWYAASEDQSSFRVEREDTDTDLIVTGDGSKRTLHARLTDEDSGVGISGRGISFWAGDAYLGTVRTDARGWATLQAPKRHRAGSIRYEAVFDGGRLYVGSRAVYTT